MVFAHAAVRFSMQGPYTCPSGPGRAGSFSATISSRLAALICGHGLAPRSETRCGSLQTGHSTIRCAAADRSRPPHARLGYGLAVARAPMNPILPCRSASGGPRFATLAASARLRRRGAVKGITSRHPSAAARSLLSASSDPDDRSAPLIGSGLSSGLVFARAVRRRLRDAGVFFVFFFFPLVTVFFSSGSASVKAQAGAGEVAMRTAPRASDDGGVARFMRPAPASVGVISPSSEPASSTSSSSPLLSDPAPQLLDRLVVDGPAGPHGVKAHDPFHGRDQRPVARELVDGPSLARFSARACGLAHRPPFRR